MFTDPTLTLAGQLFWIVDVFCKTMAPEACKRRIGLFSVAIWRRVRRFERRFSALYAMWKAGTLPKARPPRSSAEKSLDRGERREAQSEGAAAFDPMAHDAASCERARTRPSSVLPRTFRWLQQMLPSSAATLAGGVDSLLRNFPEMQAFAAAVPQVGRLLRPICKMAGIKPPDYLALPKRVRVRKKNTSRQLSEEDEEKLRQTTALFPDNPAGRSAKRVWR